MVVLKYFCLGEPNQTLLQKIRKKLQVEKILIEHCYYVELSSNCQKLSEEEESCLLWILSTPFQDIATKTSIFSMIEDERIFLETGPRLNFSTAFSTNAMSICRSVGIQSISRIEVSTRFLFKPEIQHSLAERSQLEVELVEVVCDRMTHCRYVTPPETFRLDITPESVYEVDILGQGKTALETANKQLGLAFDDWDLDYYTQLFSEKVGRNPTSVECFDLAQSNSEHSRHWFFKGRMFVDGEEKPESLFQMVMSTQAHSNQNNVIKFSDNSSGLEGYSLPILQPVNPGKPNHFIVQPDLKRHIIFTAETHNFPTGVAPFPGATTGTGGRIRDVQAAGRGAHVIAGTAGYCFGNINIPGYELPWEDRSFQYPPNFASPLDVIIEASNGASDYGNKFGEPVLAGFARSFGMMVSPEERREYIKPIMFSGGIGSLDSGHVHKMKPSTDMEVVKLGGPVYRIGVGGGAASSVQVQGDNTSELDFGAVQRGDAEMEQKLNRVIRACIELGDNNPISSIHDQGAGGNGNVLKEICEPAGAVIRTSDFQLGDPTLSVLELWGAEYQESNALLVQRHHTDILRNISRREKCPVSFVGNITGDGKIRLVDDRKSLNGEEGKSVTKRSRTDDIPVDLELELVLGQMPRKEFQLTSSPSMSLGFSKPSVTEALDRILRLPSVASKRYLTNKVDRSVTGLVAQQQCVGPLHTPLADVAVVALSHLDTVGGATAIGEQPIKCLMDPICGARMTVGEALTNLVFARISDLKDVKCSANWMWPAKLPGEGARLVQTCEAMCQVLKDVGVAVDGGKDSLSMAARVGQDTVKAPGTLVVSMYAACPDITATVTPDLKCVEGAGLLLYIPLSPGHHRLGGSALAQCYNGLGEADGPDSAPNLQDTDYFVSAFKVTQQLIQDGVIVSGHDVSDGGLVTCLLEMAFAGNCSLNLDIPAACCDGAPSLYVLFAEELGLVLEVEPSRVDSVVEAYSSQQLQCWSVGSCEREPQPEVVVSVRGEEVYRDKTASLRAVWEATSFQLERLQTNPVCVEQEERGLQERSGPTYKLTFTPEATIVNTGGKVPTGLDLPQPRVAVVREEGSNGDREMTAALHLAGFEVWDVTTQDLCTAAVSLEQFRGLVFVGGFSYADVFGSAKGWAATLRFHSGVREQLDTFYARPDTFSLGICNGCQLMALLGWVAPDDSVEGSQGVHLTHNLSQRFESRFCTVRVERSPAVLLQGMEGSVLGIWAAHGEGRMKFKNSALQKRMLTEGLVPLTYSDDNGEPTETYPMNPNGSPQGIAGLCSPDGRHLALMPHPERCVLPWQWPWMPNEWQKTMKVSPWMQMFTNAYKWCQNS